MSYLLQICNFKISRAYHSFKSSYKYCTEAYLELSQTCKIEPFAKIDNGFQQLAIFAKTSVLDVLLGSKCARYANISAMIEVGYSLNKPAVGRNSK